MTALGRIRDSLLLLALAMLPVTPLMASAAAAEAAQARTVLVIGDSLSAGYGLAADEGWVSLTAERLRAAHPGWRIVNASISGETSAGGASRIEAELARHSPEAVVIALGANDGLRGLPLAQTRANLAKMIRAAQARNARVLLVGIRIPPNYGARYTGAFAAMYDELAREHGTALLPFLLEPIATDREAFQADNLHPVAEVQPLLRDHVWTALEPLLD